LSKPGFLRSGVIDADFKVDGNRPSEKDILARVAINSEKMERQDFSKLVGMKSMGDDLF
jgi:hypothetical protein